MTILKTFTCLDLPTANEESAIADFLHQHLEAFGDPIADIQMAMDYALRKAHKPGGIIITAWEEETLIAATVINKTGMSGYIPENILVYIATHKGYRGQGIGRLLMVKAIQQTEGDIALHVESDNPARHLYESLGFTNKYLEMRLKK